MKYYLSIILFFVLLASGPERSFAELQLTGQFTQGGLLSGRVSPGSQLYYGERLIQVSPEGSLIFGFGRDAAPQQKLTLISPEGHIQHQEISIHQRSYEVQRINGINQRMMNPSAEELQRIAQEAQLVAQAREKESTQLHFKESFIWPVIGRISGVYGSQRIFNGEPRRPHFGIDIAAPKGTAVIAPAGGEVSLAHQGMFFSGATLIIDHGHGLSSSFLHLDKILVKPGDIITQGQKIATVGATGRVTGPHLDWRVNWFEQRLDPALLVPDMPGG